MNTKAETEIQIENDVANGFLDTLSIPAKNLLMIDPGEVLAVRFDGITFYYSKTTRIDYDAVCIHVKSDATDSTIGYSFGMNDLITAYTFA